MCRWACASVGCSQNRNFSNPGLDHSRHHPIVHWDHEVGGLLTRPLRWLLLYILHGLRELHGLRGSVDENRGLHHVESSWSMRRLANGTNGNHPCRC